VTLPRRWVLATSNRGKVAELDALLREAGLAFELTTQAEHGISPIEEMASTFVENALHKARHAARRSGLPALADDSGLAVDALGGSPGVRSARFAGDTATDADNVALLLRSLVAAPPPRTARFHCVLVALLHPDDPAPLIASGTWEGEVAGSPTGTGGFGYDPVFFDPRLRRPAAELTAREKNRVSHRAIALRGLLELLKNR
jgi:XTP/dITP diphosphohydrolase